MIICSCCVIRQDDLAGAVRALRKENPNAQITPNRVYRALGKRPVCNDCASLIVRRINITAADIIVREELHRGQDVPRRLR